MLEDPGGLEAKEVCCVEKGQDVVLETLLPAHLSVPAALTALIVYPSTPLKSPNGLKKAREGEG